MAFDFDYESLNDVERILLVIGVALVAHLAVVGIRRLSGHFMAIRLNRSMLKARTVVSLATSMLVFVIYFGAFGLVLAELGVPIGTYLASASIIGLAIAFGSQGIVQDVVTGLTIIFTDLFDVGEIVEIGGQTGIVQRLGMRFTVLINPMGAEVFVPNRSITNVVKYPRGYIRCLADVTLSSTKARQRKMETRTREIVTAFYEQFPGILRTPPDYEGVQETSSGRSFLRVKFRIWPGRGGPIETMFKQEIVQALKGIDPDYADWMVAINYEVERRVLPIDPWQR